MKDKKIDLLVRILYSISTILVVIGAFFYIQHYSYAIVILLIGFAIGTITSSYDTTRLKKIIKTLEEQINQDK